jgi:hypothetical protein
MVAMTANGGAEGSGCNRRLFIHNQGISELTSTP